MKKIVLVLLLVLTGCKQIESTPVISTAQEDVVQITGEEQLVYELEKNLQRNTMELAYASDVELDLEKIVLLLSYVEPFDLQIKRYEVKESQGTHYIIKVEYMEDNYAMCMKEAKKIIAKIIEKDMTTREKVDVIHQYIIDRCEYDESIQSRNKENEQAFQTYGVFFKGNAVCTGYARAFLLLLKESGIPCLYVPSDTMNHSFNLIYDDDYRYVDVTWDDPYTTYYNKSNTFFFSNDRHVLDTGFTPEYYMNFLAYMYQLPK